MGKRNKFTYSIENPDFIITIPHQDAPSGYKSVLPSSNQLLLDIDNGYQRSQLLGAIRIYNEAGFPINLQADVDSQSGGNHKHVYLEFPRDLTPIERIALQAAFGSDPTRELFSILRYLTGIENPTLLYEKEDFVQPGAVPAGQPLLVYTPDLKIQEPDPESDIYIPY